MKYYLLSFFLGLTFLGNTSFGKKEKNGNKVLDFPAKKNSIETLHYAIDGISFFNGKLLLTPYRKNFLIQTPFDEKGDSRLHRFGKLTDSKRFEVQPPHKKKHYLVSSLMFEGKVIGLDGRDLSIIEFDKNLRFSSYRTIPVDTIKPARDRGGEAPQYEINDLRRSFMKAFKAAPSQKLLGMTPVPSSKGKGRFLVLSKIKGFPIIKMKCSKINVSQCYFERACSIRGMRDLSSSELVGISSNIKRKEIYIADQSKHRILVYKYRSCLDIVKVRDILLPKKIKKIGGVFVDSSERLWVSSLLQDDYLNASVYFWEPHDWR